MRIEAFDSTAFDARHDWVFTTMDKEDAVSHLTGLAEVEVITDEIADKKLVQSLPYGKKEYWVQRRIRGHVIRRLHLWAAKAKEFGVTPILGGIRIPQDGTIYQTGQVIVSYEESTNILEILAAAILYE